MPAYALDIIAILIGAACVAFLIVALRYLRWRKKQENFILWTRYVMWNRSHFPVEDEDGLMDEEEAEVAMEDPLFQQHHNETMKRLNVMKFTFSALNIITTVIAIVPLIAALVSLIQQNPIQAIRLDLLSLTVITALKALVLFVLKWLGVYVVAALSGAANKFGGDLYKRIRAYHREHNRLTKSHQRQRLSSGMGSAAHLLGEREQWKQEKLREKRLRERERQAEEHRKLYAIFLERHRKEASSPREHF